MATTLHLEALARRDGAVLLYLTDFWRRPVPLDAVRGSVTLRRSNEPLGATGGERHALALDDASGALVATGLAFAADDRVDARFDLVVAGEPVEMDFTLPIEAAGSGTSVETSSFGAAGIAPGGCVHEAPADLDRGQHVPRCSLRFAHPVSALAFTPGGSRLLVAAVDLGVSVWEMPDVRLVASFAPPPAVAVPGPEGLRPHSESVNALAVSPDGTEALVALEGRLLRYTIATGRLAGELPRRRGVVRSAAWAPDGESVVVTVFYDPAAQVLGARDGGERLRLAVPHEGTAIAFDSGARQVAVASESGPIGVFDWPSGALRRRMTPAVGWSQDLSCAPALVSAGDPLPELVLSAGSDGMLRAWELETGKLKFETRVARSLQRVAVSPDGRLVAVAGGDGTLEIVDRSGTVRETLAWHASGISALAWAGSTLISGDLDGRVAVWDLPDER
jgi:WD40 repeat protein